jgi:hypothetical protein
VALKLLKPTKSGTLVLATAGVWSSSRSSNPAASRDRGPFQQSASTAHTSTLLSRSPITAPLRRRHLTGNGRAPPTVTVSAGFLPQNADHSAPHHRSGCTHGAQNPLAALALPSFPIESQKSDQTPAPNPHSLTPAPVRTPPRFPPSRLFGRLPPCLPSRPRLQASENP